MEFDISKIPFSRFGSYFALSSNPDMEEVYLRDLHGGDEKESKLFTIKLLKDNIPQRMLAKGKETHLTIYENEKGDSYIEICIPFENQLHILVKNTQLSLRAHKSRYDSIMALGDDTYEYHVYYKELKLKISLIKGNMEVDAPWKVIGNDYIQIRVDDGDDDYAHIVIESYKTVSTNKDYIDFYEAKELVKRKYDTWLENMPLVPSRYRRSRELASYITWSSVVGKSGLLKDYAMYMSKNWMNNIWSWDNCFNALMLAEKFPSLAYSQYRIFIDHQDESGTYPDFVNDQFVSYNCTKPPIFPYFYKLMMDRNDYFKDEERLLEAYNSFKRMLHYWLNYRCFDGALPHYRHGNDSGWDNASIFHEGMPVEAPDLSAHLIRSLDSMAYFAQILGLEGDRIKYREQADKLYKRLMERLYDEEGFYARVGYRGERVNNRDSLILRLPIIIGYRLEDKVLDGLVKDLVANFESRYGLTTERMDSPFYNSKGYWLGPIWAPVTFLFVEALCRYGYEEEGLRIAEKFLELTLLGGMAENFHPITGEGLVDPAFTWTSSVFLLLGEKIYRHKEDKDNA